MHLKTPSCRKREGKGAVPRWGSDIEREIARLFDLVDADLSGYVDAVEFRDMLHAMGSAGQLEIPQVERMMREIMAGDNENDGGMPTPVRLSREHFVTAVMSGKLGGASPETWANYVATQRARSEILSVTFQFLGLIHAPVSAKLFNYFDVHELNGRAFLRVDYSLEQNTQKWTSFLVVVVVFLFALAVGLPVLLGATLFINRKRLYTPHVKEKFGFLYDGYHKGTEYWDVHELVRRMSLTGLVIFLPATTRLAVMLIISVAAVRWNSMRVSCSLVSPLTLLPLTNVNLSSFSMSH